VVLETSHAARQRGVEAYAEVAGFGVGSSLSDRTRAEACLGALQPIQTSNPAFLLSASEDDQASQELERSVLAAAGIRPSVSIAPKPCAGNLFAAATALQLGLGAVATRRLACHQTTLVHCFGEGTEQGAFWLRRP
jgi:3-oxoacyl-(acyl-carrier-protein) synthase